MFRTLKPSLLVLLLGVAGFAQVAWAGDFVPIVPIPGIDYGNVNMEAYLKVLYILAISFAALLAVGQLVLAGFQYITSEIVTDKEEAKKRIRAAIVGLFIILIAVTVLRTINPDMANLPALSAPPKPDITRPTAETVGGIDALDVAQAREACEAKEDEGYVFKVHSGDWANPLEGVECCIPGGSGADACRGDTSDEIGGITIDTSIPYSRDEFDLLMQNLRDSGATVTAAPILLANIEREKQTCSAEGGTPYVVQRDRGIAYTTPQHMLLCVMNNTEDALTSEMLTCEMPDPDPDMTLMEYCGDAITACEGEEGFLSWTEFFDPHRIECVYEN